MFFAAFSGGLIAASGMIINDIFDYEIDKVNKPKRPIASGKISLQSASTFYGILVGISLLLNLFLYLNAQIIAMTAIILLFYYSYKLKRTPLIGNIVIGLLTGFAFIYGGAVAGNIEQTIFPAMFAFLINVGREIIKDMEDVEGDAKEGAVTFPIKYGIKKAGMVASIFLIVLMIVTIIPVIIHYYGMQYFFSVMLGVNSVILYVIISLMKNQSVKNLHTLSTILKYDMVVGLIAIYVG